MLNRIVRLLTLPIVAFMVCALADSAAPDGSQEYCQTRVTGYPDNVSTFTCSWQQPCAGGHGNQCRRKTIETVPCIVKTCSCEDGATTDCCSMFFEDCNGALDAYLDGDCYAGDVDCQEGECTAVLVDVPVGVPAQHEADCLPEPQ